MKVLFLTRCFGEGEAATEYVKAVAHELVEQGDEAVVVAFDDGAYYSVDDRVEVRRVGLPFEGDNMYNWSMMMNNELKKEAQEAFKDGKPDIIHSIDWTAVPGGVALSRHLDKPLVVTFQSTENERGFGGEQAGVISELEWQGAFEAEKAIATSEDTKNSLLFDLDVPEEKIDIIDPFSDNWQQRVLNSYRDTIKQEKEVKN
jgi:hypothetical protein